MCSTHPVLNFCQSIDLSEDGCSHKLLMAIYQFKILSDELFIKNDLDFKLLPAIFGLYSSNSFKI